MSGIGADLLEDCSEYLNQQWQEHGCQWYIKQIVLFR